jgi:hypothetical protein
MMCVDGLPKKSKKRQVPRFARNDSPPFQKKQEGVRSRSDDCADMGRSVLRPYTELVR